MLKGKTVSNRIPSLDGLRALSILLVVFGHAFRAHLHHYVDIANLGVRVFFIISAYLIVGILYRDVEKNRFSLKSFYFKRLMRTFPAFYTYIIVILILLLSLDLLDFEQFWRAPIYLENYHSRSVWNSKQWFIGHSWSLAVEEQFYLLVALLFYLLYKQKITKKTVIRILVFMLVFAPACRVSYMLFKSIPDVLRGSVHRSFETVVDSIAIGGILALIGLDRISKIKVISYFKNKVWLLFPVVLLIQSLNSSYIRELFGLKIRFVYNSIGLTVINILFTVIIFNSIYHARNTIFTKVLNSKTLIFIGMLSYSIYLWQQVWLYKWGIPEYTKYIGIVVCSLMSYYLIEIKFLNLRDRILLKKKV